MCNYYTQAGYYSIIYNVQRPLHVNKGLIEVNYDYIYLLTYTTHKTVDGYSKVTTFGTVCMGLAPVNTTYFKDTTDSRATGVKQWMCLAK